MTRLDWELVGDVWVAKYGDDRLVVRNGRWCMTEALPRFVLDHIEPEMGLADDDEAAKAAAEHHAAGYPNEHRLRDDDDLELGEWVPDKACWVKPIGVPGDRYPVLWLGAYRVGYNWLYGIFLQNPSWAASEGSYPGGGKPVETLQEAQRAAEADLRRMADEIIGCLQKEGE